MIVLISKDKRIPTHLKNYCCYLVSAEYYINDIEQHNVRIDLDGGIYVNLDSITPDFYDTLRKFSLYYYFAPDVIRYYKFDDQDIDIPDYIYEGISIFPSNMEEQKFDDQFLTQYDINLMTNVAGSLQEYWKKSKRDIQAKINIILPDEDTYISYNTNEIIKEQEDEKKRKAAKYDMDIVVSEDTRLPYDIHENYTHLNKWNFILRLNSNEGLDVENIIYINLDSLDETLYKNLNENLNVINENLTVKDLPIIYYKFSDQDINALYIKEDIKIYEVKDK